MSSGMRVGASARRALYEAMSGKIEVNPHLTRSLVSYQANRNRPFYRWFKYKEGFSAALVEHFIADDRKKALRVLDPFSGAGVTLLVSKELGYDALGYEILPVGIAITEARLAAGRVPRREFVESVRSFRSGAWLAGDALAHFSHLPITEGAFPAATETQIAKFRAFVLNLANDDLKNLYNAAGLAVLESVSYTRKDGQYLRWDERAQRRLNGKRFNKGKILSFRRAIERQLAMMADDLSSSSLFESAPRFTSGTTRVEMASCLTQLPALPDACVDLVVTSPPYCNRYDYTRTYALELAYLGVDEPQLKALRQNLLSCTVENRSKLRELSSHYERIGCIDRFNQALSAFECQAGLQEILTILEAKGKQGLLNNANVPRMVRNYFVESAVVIFELARVVDRGGRVILVNDNVQYAGEEVPVDLILSDIASKAGFATERIWILGRGKGNSSQQMGVHGRNELRKCAYVWRRTG